MADADPTRRRRAEALAHHLRVHDRAAVEWERRVNDWADQYWRGRHCPVCGHDDDWTLGDIVEFRDWGEALKAGADAYPVLQIVCENCGYVLLINTVLADLPTIDEIRAELEEPE